MPGVASQRQVRRGLPARSLLPGRRTRRRHRATGHRARQAALWRRARQRPAVFRQPRQHGCVLCAAEARRHGHGYGAESGRPPDPRQPGQLLGPVLQVRPLRRGSRIRGHRLRPRGGSRTGAPTETDRCRRFCLLAHHRLAAHFRNRRQCRRAFHGRHRAHRRPDRRRRPSQPGAVRRRGDDDHPQEPARPTWRADPVQAGVGQGH